MLFFHVPTYVYEILYKMFKVLYLDEIIYNNLLNNNGFTRRALLNIYCIVKNNFSTNFQSLNLSKVSIYV